MSKANQAKFFYIKRQRWTKANVKTLEIFRFKKQNEEINKNQYFMPVFRENRKACV